MKKESFWLLFIVIGYQTISLSIAIIPKIVLGFLGLRYPLPSRSILVLIAVIFNRSFHIFNMSMLYAALNRSILISAGLNDKKSSLEKLKSILKIHNKFCDALRLLNKCLSVNLMINILKSVFHFILVMFDFYQYLVYDISSANRMLFITSLISFVPEGIFIAITIASSSFLKAEATKSLSIIHSKASKCERNSETLKFLQLAAMQFEHQSPEISCGCFTLDWNLLFTILAGCFSSIIILIQFDISESN